MTPQEIYDKEIWETLQKIKLEILRANERPILIRYENSGEEKNALRKLEEEQVIKVIKESLKYAGLYTLNNPSTSITEEKINVNDFMPTSGIIFIEILPKFDKFYKKYKQKFPIYRNKLKCGALNLDLDKPEIQYKKRKPIIIQPGSNNIKFLAILLRNKRVVGYKEIALELGFITSSRSEVTDIDVAKQVIAAKEELTDFLEKIVGMDIDEINGMIINIKKIGYKIVRV